MTANNETYDMLLKLVKTRHSVRKFKPDPIPEDTIDKILEVARWAMSGANSQPWEFIVVTDPNTKKELRDAYSEYNTDFDFLDGAAARVQSAPSFLSGEKRSARISALQQSQGQLAPGAGGDRRAGRRPAPVGHGDGAHTFGRDQSHLTDGLANACLLASSRHRFAGSHFRVGIHPYRGAAQADSRCARSAEALPDYSHRLSRCSARGDGVRRPLEDMVHRERYDMSKYMSNEDVIKYLYRCARRRCRSFGVAPVVPTRKNNGPIPLTPFQRGIFLASALTGWGDFQRNSNDIGRNSK